ncbi:MAG TPA: hypothetical protein VF099_12180, partial [Ktedonobacterales bacterium]
MPPWSVPTNYCNAMAGDKAASQPGWPDIKVYGGSWTSDNVFCMAGAAGFWQTCLYIALAFWGFFTVLQLFTTFDIQHGHGHALARAIQHLMRQVILFCLACGSFFLMLLVHQLTWLMENAIVGGGLDQWRVDGIWAGTATTPGASQVMAEALQAIGQPNFWQNISGGTSSAPWNFNDPSIFSNTLPQIWSGLGFVQMTVLQATGSIRFVVMFLLVGVAPLAIISSSFHPLRHAVFQRWLNLWLELEGLALLTALGVTAFSRSMCGTPGLQCLNTNLLQILEDLLAGKQPPQVLTANMGPMQFAFLMLGFAAIVCGLQLGYIWNLIGNMLSMGTEMYQAQYNRDVANAKADSNILSGVLEVGGAIASAVGFPEVGVPAMMVGGAISNASNTAQSAIPQANGYGNGGTMGALPEMSGAFQDAGGGGDGSSDGSGGGGGGGGGGSGGPVAFLGRPQTTQNGTTQAQFNISNRGMSVVAMRYANTSGAATSGQAVAGT